MMLIVSTIGTIFVYSYHKDTYNQTITADKSSYLPFIIYIFASLLFVTLNSHSSPQLNHTFSLIDNYCHILMQLCAVLKSISLPSISIFLITRMKNIFKSTPFGITSSQYQIQIILSVFVGILAMFHNVMLKPTIFIANDDGDYKLCHIQLDNQKPPPIAWIPILLNDVYLYYVFHTKYTEYKHGEDINDNILRHARNLKRAMILLLISKFIIVPIIAALFMIYKVRYLFALNGVIDCYILMYAMSCKSYDNDDNGRNNSSEEEIDRYLMEIENAYYAVPPRLQHMLDGESDSVPLIQIEGQ